MAMKHRDEEKRNRLDKWLWAARFFKTRSLAAEEVSGGKVYANSERTKPSREVHIGDRLSIRCGAYKWVVVVQNLSRQRGPAKDAALLYEETEESRENRHQLQLQIAQQPQLQPYAKGRPSKRARRQLNRFTRSD